MSTGEITFQIWGQDNNTFRMILKSYVKNGSLKSRNLSEEKNPSRAQIFRYFRIESRNKTARIGVQPWIFRLPLRFMEQW